MTKTKQFLKSILVTLVCIATILLAFTIGVVPWFLGYVVLDCWNDYLNIVVLAWFVPSVGIAVTLMKPVFTWAHTL